MSTSMRSVFEVISIFCKAGTVLFKQGDPPGSCYALRIWLGDLVGNSGGLVLGSQDIWIYVIYYVFMYSGITSYFTYVHKYILFFGGTCVHWWIHWPENRLPSPSFLLLSISSPRWSSQAPWASSPCLMRRVPRLRRRSSSSRSSATCVARQGSATLWLWRTVRHGIDGPNRNRWLTYEDSMVIFLWRTVSHNQIYNSLLILKQMSGGYPWNLMVEIVGNPNMFSWNALWLGMFGISGVPHSETFSGESWWLCHRKQSQQNSTKFPYSSFSFENIWCQAD